MAKVAYITGGASGFGAEVARQLARRGDDVVLLDVNDDDGKRIADEHFDLATYKRAMGINLDGVVYGVHAALPVLRRRGGGSIVCTASMAGLTAVPFDPVYGANKHAVVGLVRAMGLLLAGQNITINAFC